MAALPTARELAATVFQITQNLANRGFLSRAENLSIHREGMEAVRPLGVIGSPERLDLSLLERAEKEGRFWFDGTVSGLKVVMEEPLRGELELGMERMTFTTIVNSLHYKDFEAAAARMRELADELGLALAFGKGVEMYDVNLVVSMEARFSSAHADDFIDKVLLLQHSTEGL